MKESRTGVRERITSLRNAQILLRKSEQKKCSLRTLVGCVLLIHIRVLRIPVVIRTWVVATCDNGNTLYIRQCTLYKVQATLHNGKLLNTAQHQLLASTTKQPAHRGRRPFLCLSTRASVILQLR